MIFRIIEPTAAVFEGSESELSELKQMLTYTNTSVSYLISKHSKNKWFKASKPEEWRVRMNELQAEAKKTLVFQKNGLTFVRPGSLPFLKEAGLAFDVEDYVEYPKDGYFSWKVPPKFQPYEYQSRSVEELRKARHGAISICTGGGKSLISAMLTKAHGLKTVVIVPSKSIFIELFHFYETHFGKGKVGAFGNGKKDITKDITVAIGKSLTLVEEGSPEFEFFQKKQVLIADECFPYNTKVQTSVGPLRIGDIYSRYKKQEIKVVSYNETTRSFEYKRVTNAWKRPMKTLVSVECNGGTTFRCTPNHKILTSNKGWVAAGDLQMGDTIVSYVKEEQLKASTRTPVLDTNSDFYDFAIGSYLGDGHFDYAHLNPRMAFTHGKEQTEYAMWKFNMLGSVRGSFREILENGFSKKPAIQFNSRNFYFLKKFPNNKKTVPQWIVDSINEKSLAIWLMDDGSLQTDRYGNPRTITFSTDSFDKDSVLRLTHKLASMGLDSSIRKTKKGNFYIVLNKASTVKLIDLVSKFCHFSMRYKTGFNNQVGKYKWDVFSANGHVTTVRKVTKTEFQLTKRSCHNFLFDIEVEDNHNFVVGGKNSGIVAHNCHTWAASELDTVCNSLLKNVPYRYFMSGTQTRGDGAIKLLQSITGPVVYDLTTKQAIEGGFLSPVETRIMTVESDSNCKSSDIAKMKRAHFLYNRNILDKAATIANSMAAKRNETTLILVEEIEQISELVKRLNVPHGYIHGNTTKSDELKRLGLEKSDLKETLLKFNRGEIKVLIGTPAIEVGTNIFCHNGINLQGGASEINVKQGIIGRMVRRLDKSSFAALHPPKEKARLFDFKVQDVEPMERHLKTRIKFYEETGGAVIFV